MNFILAFLYSVYLHITLRFNSFNFIMTIFMAGD
jgi:hypothetical protein